MQILDSMIDFMASNVNTKGDRIAKELIKTMAYMLITWFFIVIQRNKVYRANLVYQIIECQK